MKLAEALIMRSDCQKRIAQLKSRLLANARVQENEVPAERPEDLIKELELVSEQLVDLVKRINRTNSTTEFSKGKSIADVLAQRDVLVVQRQVYVELAATAAFRQDRFTRSEVKYISTINVTETQKRADELSRNYRELDARVQEVNWRTELLD
jgi:predicted ATP-dependent Lon-type protease